MAATATDRGFFIRSGDRHVFVLPAQPAQVAQGDTIGVSGVILQMPHDMGERLSAPGELRKDVHIYATRINR